MVLTRDNYEPAHIHRFGCYQTMGDLQRGEVHAGPENGRVNTTFGFRQHREKLHELLAIPGLWNQVYATVALSIAGFLSGTVEGWPGSISLILSGSEKTKQSHGRSGGINDLQIGTQEMSKIFVFMVLSAMVHMMITGALLNRFGRKGGCWFLNFLAPSGWVFLINAQTLSDLYIGATLIGTISLSGEIVGVTFLSEVTSEKLRGPLISLLMFSNSLGIFASHILLVEFDIRSFHMFCLGVTLVFPFMFWRIPESPAFLMKKSRVEDARKSVAWYHGNKPEVIEHEMENLKNAAIVHLGRCKAVLCDQSNRKAMNIVVILFILAELTGTSVVEVFAGTLISKMNLPATKTMSAKSASLILATCRFFGGILNVYFVERSGRKPTLTLSLRIMALLLGMIFVLMIISKEMRAMPTSRNTDTSHQILTICINISFYLTLICFSLYTLANQMFLGTTEVLSGELLTVETKGTVMALAGFMRILTLVISILVFNYAIYLDGSWNFLLYLISSGLGAFWAKSLVPETQGKCLNEIHRELEETSDVIGPRNSSSVADDT